MAVCVVLVVESAAPAAAIGSSQFFWWIALLILFFLPYGLVSAELGTTYDDEGGIYDWVKRAFGRKWGARVAWLYWINYPILDGEFSGIVCRSYYANFPGFIWDAGFDFYSAHFCVDCCYY